VAHLATGRPVGITSAGIPLAVANVNLIPIPLWPLGRGVVPMEVARARGVDVLTADAWR
jgi:uncharacterized membrane protein YccF (DUF307 family)